jgi:hypothetical protein
MRGPQWDTRARTGTRITQTYLNHPIPPNYRYMQCNTSVFYQITGNMSEFVWSNFCKGVQLHCTSQLIDDSGIDEAGCQPTKMRQQHDACL